MKKIIDTIGLDYMVKNGRSTTDHLYITPDIQEEFETGHDIRLPHNVENLFDTPWFDQAVFLDSYRKMLNAYGGRSFYSMRGFGDISILAALDAERVAAGKVLPGMHGPIEVVTADQPLVQKIRKEFLSNRDAFADNLSVLSPENYFSSK